MTIKNRKVINATENIYDGIQFKSKLEKGIYQIFKERGFDIRYEDTKLTIWNGFKPKAIFFSSKSSSFSDKKIQDITYTPDFTIYTNDKIIYIEAKGFRTDAYNIKIKLIRGYLESVIGGCILIEISSLKQARMLSDALYKYLIEGDEFEKSFNCKI